MGVVRAMFSRFRISCIALVGLAYSLSTVVASNTTSTCAAEELDLCDVVTTTPTPTPNTVQMTQVITFGDLTSPWSPSQNETDAFNLGYRLTIGTGPSVCPTCSCSFSHNRRSVAVTFTALHTAALAAAAESAANALVSNPAALANNIATAASTLGVSLSYTPNASAMSAATASTVYLTSDDDDNTGIIVGFALAFLLE